MLFIPSAIKKKNMIQEKNINEFNRDVLSNNGYLYTSPHKLSAYLCNKRFTQAIVELVDLKGKSVIDIGCGDGTYSIELLGLGAKSVLGVDAADAAVGIAQQKSYGLANISFKTCDIYEMPPPDNLFQVAIVRGFLHHLYYPERAISNICEQAREIIVIEPNGLNPILKIIEKTSRYHIEHEEKSYWPASLDRWFISHGGKIEKSLYVGLVPMFCPDGIARMLKVIEPFIEQKPFLCRFCCGQYIMKVRMN
jgi:ubiquinone/menaquinone biosynthesis C-methylase UbiE